MNSNCTNIFFWGETCLWIELICLTSHSFCLLVLVTKTQWTHHRFQISLLQNWEFPLITTWWIERSTKNKVNKRFHKPNGSINVLIDPNYKRQTTMTCSHCNIHLILDKCISLMAKHFLMHKDEMVNASPQTKDKSINIPIGICGNLV